MDPRHEKEPECERDTGASVCKADSKEATPLLVVVAFDVYDYLLLLLLFQTLYYKKFSKMDILNFESPKF